jgi:hypothetical protein
LLHPAVEFLTVLFADLSGCIELRPIPDPAHIRTFVPLDDGGFDPDAVVRYTDACNYRQLAAYYGVAVRKAGATSGRSEDCTLIPALFVDADFKHKGEDATWARLAEFPLPPSIVVATGGGVHCFWLLDRPLPLTATTAQTTRDLMRRLAAAVADVVDESVSEPARVLRLPGSFNYKKSYGEPRPVTLDVCDGDARYSLDEILRHVPERVTPRAASLRPGDASYGGFRLCDTVGEGDRHSTLFALVRSLQQRGLSVDATRAAVAVTNDEKFEPPLSIRELEASVRRAYRTPHRSF